MKKLFSILSAILVLIGTYLWYMPSVIAQWVEVLPYTITCGEQRIEGQLQTSDIKNTVLDTYIEWVDTKNTEWVMVDKEGVSYSIDINSQWYTEWWYDIVVEASLWNKSVLKDHLVYFEDWTCDTAQAIKKRVEAYADEAETFFEMNEEVQLVPASFLKAWLWQWIDGVIASTAETFAMSKSPVYHNTPERTTDPFALNYPDFEDQYSIVPSPYRWATAYLHFKSLLIPIVLPDGWESEDELLDLLDTGALLAPETKSMDTIGSVKMLYTHSLSFNDSPFSGVWSFLSLFAEQGDEFNFYINTWNGKYEKRGYIMTSRIQVKPEDTHHIKAFRKDGADTIAMITCKDWTVLGSTRWREVLFLERKSDELKSLQKVILSINENPSLHKQKEIFDKYLKAETLSDEAVVKLVKQLELVEQDTWNPLTAIATYGKYMTAYEAIYQ